MSGMGMDQTGGLVGMNRFLGQQGVQGMQQAAEMQDQREAAARQAEAARRATQTATAAGLGGMLTSMAIAYAMA